MEENLWLGGQPPWAEPGCRELNGWCIQRIVGNAVWAVPMRDISTSPSQTSSTQLYCSTIQNVFSIFKSTSFHFLCCQKMTDLCYSAVHGHILWEKHAAFSAACEHIGLAWHWGKHPAASKRLSAFPDLFSLLYLLLLLCWLAGSKPAVRN